VSVGLADWPGRPPVGAALLVCVRVTRTVEATGVSPALVGVWVITDVITSVVGVGVGAVVVEAGVFDGGCELVDDSVAELAGCDCCDDGGCDCDGGGDEEGRFTGVEVGGADDGGWVEGGAEEGGDVRDFSEEGGFCDGDGADDAVVGAAAVEDSVGKGDEEGGGRDDGADEGEEGEASSAEGDVLEVVLLMAGNVYKEKSLGAGRRIDVEVRRAQVAVC
jgi:hypothetical protein